jgi:hypothetical protein
VKRKRRHLTAEFKARVAAEAFKGEKTIHTTMQTFFTIIGFAACTAVAMLALFKAIDAVWFFKEFRKDITKSLDRIEERLRNIKP